MCFTIGVSGILGLLPLANAHMRLARPEPLNLAIDPFYDGPLERFSIQAPFPCRGHLTALSAAPPTATWAAGSNQAFSLTGSSPHYGGSCQVSLSYDEGKTWKVIKSFPGSCPNRSSYLGDQVFNFNIPAEAPASDNVVFSWSWFNREEEMYHNCAKVIITNDNPTVKSNVGPALGDYPDMFVADVPSVNSCKSPRSWAEVMFPNPGDENRIEYGDGEYPLAPPHCE